MTSLVTDGRQNPAEAPCTRCGATPETGQTDGCPECEGVLEPRRSSLFKFLRPSVGRGFCPPSGGARGYWLVWGCTQFELHPLWWRLGVSLRLSPLMLGLQFGPFVVGIGVPTMRWRTCPATTTALAGDCWQDHSFTLTWTSGGSA